MSKSNEQPLEASVTSRINEQNKSKYFIDEASHSIVNFSYIDSVNWYIVNQIPLDVLFSEIGVLKQRIFLALAILMAAFIIIITFTISKTITRPLYYLQRKMKDVINKRFKVRLPEQKYKGEILHLTQTFNQMMDDMDDLIQRLKVEERQKEAVHFQMLLSQKFQKFVFLSESFWKPVSIRRST